jgi:hypothetical protein
MKRFILLLALTLVGCNRPQTFHVTAVDFDARAEVTGTFQGKEYGLSPSWEHVPLGQASYHPIRTEDIGKDFPATAGPDGTGTLILSLPFPDGVRQIKYNIETVREK